MKIGVISDTHGQLTPQAYAALADCDAIVHAGDIGGPDIVRELETLAPVVAVQGNCDYDEYGAAVGQYATPVFDGVRFLVAHKPKQVRVGFGAPGVQPGDPVPQVCVHGHTHVPRIMTGADAAPAQYVVCPGSATRPRDGYERSVAFVEVADGRVLSVRIESLTGSILRETIASRG